MKNIKIHIAMLLMLVMTTMAPAATSCPAPSPIGSSDKSQVLKTRLNRLLSTERLTVPQVQFISELRDFLSPSLFGGEPRSPEVSQQMKNLEDRAISLFGGIQRMAYFSAIPRNLPAFALEQRNISVPEVQFTTVALGKPFAAPRRNNCHCSIGSSFNMQCEKTNQCSFGPMGCSRTEDGCGFLGFYECNGNCYTVRLDQPHDGGHSE